MSKLAPFAWPVVLALTTCLTCTWAGAWHWVTFEAVATGHAPGWYTVDAWMHGLWFTLALVGSLAVHDGAHLLVARRHRLACDGPYILPAPFALIGTLGAFIRLRSPYETRAQMIDVAAAGPLAGFAWSLVAAWMGLRWSIPMGVHAVSSLVRFGTPTVMRWLMPHDVVLHPLAAGAWIGLLVTMVNLLPFEHFDGGTLLHALYPRAFRIVWVLAMAAAFYLAGANIFGGALTWAIVLGIAILVLLTAGFQSCPEAAETLPRRSGLLAALCALALALSWTAL